MAEVGFTELGVVGLMVTMVLKEAKTLAQFIVDSVRTKGNGASNNGSGRVPASGCANAPNFGRLADAIEKANDANGLQVEALREILHSQRASRDILERLSAAIEVRNGS